MEKPIWKFNGVIICEVRCVPGCGKTYWYADIHLTTQLVSQDDLHVLKDFFPLSKNLLVTESDG